MKRFLILTAALLFAIGAQAQTTNSEGVCIEGCANIAAEEMRQTQQSMTSTSSTPEGSASTTQIFSPDDERGAVYDRYGTCVENCRKK